MQLDVRKSPSLVAAIQVMVTMPREAAKATRKYTKAVVQPEWKRGVADHAPAARMFQSRIVAPTAAYVTDRGVRLVSGKGDLVRQTEFGAAREQYVSYTRKGRRGGKSQHVTRRTARQFYHYNPDGYAVYPAARDLIPRIAALWVQTIYRTVAETIEQHVR